MWAGWRSSEQIPRRTNRIHRAPNEVEADFPERSQRWRDWVDQSRAIPPVVSPNQVHVSPRRTKPSYEGGVVKRAGADFAAGSSRISPLAVGVGRSVPSSDPASQRPDSRLPTPSSEPEAEGEVSPTAVFHCEREPTGRETLNHL